MNILGKGKQKIDTSRRSPPESGKNFDHRKVWIEEQLKTQAANFGIDLLSMTILANHFRLNAKGVCPPPIPPDSLPHKHVSLVIG